MRLSRSACAQEVASRAFAMPLLNPSYPRGPHRFKDREYLIITYRTDRKTLEAAIPAPLRLPRDADPLVKWETIKMPDSQGFGDYTEGGLVIPVEYERADGTLVKGSFVHSMYLDAAGPISGGREIWGFPKKLGHPTFTVERDCLVGTLRKGSVTVAQGSMGYKHKAIKDLDALRKSMENEPNFLVKAIPKPDMTGPDVLELVQYHLENVDVQGAWTGPVGLSLTHHAMAPMATFPVREVIAGIHIKADLTLGLGRVVYDYLADRHQ